MTLPGIEPTTYQSQGAKLYHETKNPRTALISERLWTEFVFLKHVLTIYWVVCKVTCAQMKGIKAKSCQKKWKETPGNHLDSSGKAFQLCYLPLLKSAWFSHFFVQKNISSESKCLEAVAVTLRDPFLSDWTITISHIPAWAERGVQRRCQWLHCAAVTSETTGMLIGCSPALPPSASAPSFWVFSFFPTPKTTECWWMCWLEGRQSKWPPVSEMQRRITKALDWVEVEGTVMKDMAGVVGCWQWLLIFILLKFNVHLVKAGHCE